MAGCVEAILEYFVHDGCTNNTVLCVASPGRWHCRQRPGLHVAE